MIIKKSILFCVLVAFGVPLCPAAPNPHPVKNPRAFETKFRASEIDKRCKSYPAIGFVLADKNGKPTDLEIASVDTRVASQGKLVIWLMGHNGGLAKEVNGMGLHYLQVAYAREWFGILSQGKKLTKHSRGDIRLEAATGEDRSDELAIAVPDSIKGRAFSAVKYLAQKNPEGHWEQFLALGGYDLDWEKVILSGISHGSTTAARLAKDTKVARVVCFSGPRDQFQNWQSLPSATPENRYFGFTHIQDEGWKNDHYCRSWLLLALNKFGPIVNVEKSQPPFENTRRLITDFDVNNNPDWAHGAVVPNGKSKKSKDGKFAHAEVWRYLFTHPVDEVGQATPPDTACRMDFWKE